MKVVLLEDVKSLGKKGDIVEVSEGYARNFLLSKKHAVEATAANLNTLKLQKANKERIEAENLAAAKALADRISSASVTLSMKAGESGKTFGSVTSKEIAQALAEQSGIEVDKKKINLPEAIKTFGVQEVVIKLHKDVTATLKVMVKEQ